MPRDSVAVPDALSGPPDPAPDPEASVPSADTPDATPDVTHEDTPPADPEALSPADFDPELQAQRDAVEYEVSLITKVTAIVNGVAKEGEEDPQVEHTVVEVESPLAVTLTAVDRSADSPYASLLDEHGRIVLTESPVKVPGTIAEQLNALPYVKVEAV